MCVHYREDIFMPLRPAFFDALKDLPQFQGEFITKYMDVPRWFSPRLLDRTIRYTQICGLFLIGLAARYNISQSIRCKSLHVFVDKSNGNKPQLQYGPVPVNWVQQNAFAMRKLMKSIVPPGGTSLVSSIYCMICSNLMRFSLDV
jgi:hypothetical protein